MKWLHLPWHIEGNRVVNTKTYETILRFTSSIIPLEQNRDLQLACDQIVHTPGERPWVLLDDVLQLIKAAGYMPEAMTA